MFLQEYIGQTNIPVESNHEANLKHGNIFNVLDFMFTFCEEFFCSHIYTMGFCNAFVLTFKWSNVLLFVCVVSACICIFLYSCLCCMCKYFFDQGDNLNSLCCICFRCMCMYFHDQGDNLYFLLCCICCIYCISFRCRCMYLYDLYLLCCICCICFRCMCMYFYDQGDNLYRIS